MLREFESAKPPIDLKDFYQRRCFRIFPAYYDYVGMVALLIPTGLVWAHYFDVLPAVL